MIPPFEPARYLVATSAGPREVEGWTWRGVGVRLDEAHNVWIVTHLGTGHAVASVAGDFFEAAAPVKAVAEAIDWRFERPEDAPFDAALRILEVADLYPNVEPAGSQTSDAAQAGEIAAAMAAAGFAQGRRDADPSGGRP